jgi:hypothetical protein
MAITLIHKLTNAVQKLGLSNGTKITKPDYGGDEPKNNEAVSTWFDEWAVAAEYTVAKTVAGVAEKRAEKAKAAVLATFAKSIKDVNIGDSNSVVRGNVALLFARRNAPRRINRQSVINVLTTEYNWKLDDINALLEKIDLASPDGALWITPSTTME